MEWGRWCGAAPCDADSECDSFSGGTGSENGSPVAAALFAVLFEGGVGEFDEAVFVGGDVFEVPALFGQVAEETESGAEKDGGDGEGDLVDEAEGEKALR